MKSRSRYESILAWVLTVVMTVTLIPLTGRTAYAAQDTPEEILSPEEVTEENVTEKSLDSTTYELGGGQKMTVFHEGNVRYEAEDGTLIDYDPSLKAEEELDGYAYTNTAGDMKVHVPEGLGEESPLLIGDEEYQIGCSLSEESKKICPDKMGANRW